MAISAKRIERSYKKIQLIIISYKKIEMSTRDKYENSIKCNVVTAQKIDGVIFADKIGGKLFKNKQRPSLQPLHIHFISDEEIRVGDVVFNSEYSVETIDDQSCPLTGDKKIIASTDKSFGLPLIPEVFINEYINENGKSNTVLLLRSSGGFYDSKSKWHWAPIITHDNHVVIYQEYLIPLIGE